MRLAKLGSSFMTKTLTEYPCQQSGCVFRFLWSIRSISAEGVVSAEKEVFMERVPELRGQRGAPLSLLCEFAWCDVLIEARAAQSYFRSA